MFKLAATLATLPRGSARDIGWCSSAARGVRTYGAAVHPRHRVYSRGRKRREGRVLVQAAQLVGYFVETAVEQRTSGRLATVRLRRTGEPIVEVLFAACGIEAEIARSATALSVLGKLVPVASIGHLIAMKLVSRDSKKRPRDEEDLLALARVADEGE